MTGTPTLSNTACWFQGSPTQYPFMVPVFSAAGICGGGITDSSTSAAIWPETSFGP
jgi:hypothetical protein